MAQRGEGTHKEDFGLGECAVELYASREVVAVFKDLIELQRHGPAVRSRGGDRRPPKQTSVRYRSMTSASMTNDGSV